MNELVAIVGNDVFTDSMIISRGTGIGHRKIKDSIKKYQDLIEQFGLLVSCQAESTGGRPEEYYRLSEQQATFLITLLKNTDTVVKFKLELVRQFYEMRKFILERQSSQWLDTRYQGKLTRKAETDIIMQLTEYAKAQGSKNAEKLYVVYSKLANQIAGLDGRDQATINQLNNLNLIENIILHCIEAGILAEKHYKEIYQDCKKRLLLFSNLAYLEQTDFMKSDLAI